MENSTKIESVAKVLIVNNSRQALILTLGKHLQYPDRSFLPDLPGGIVEQGESERGGAIRETQEETGIILEAQDMRLAYAATTYSAEENKSVSKLLYIAWVHETPEVVLSWEHSEYQWVPLDKLQSIALRPFFKQAIVYSLDKGFL